MKKIMFILLIVASVSVFATGNIGKLEIGDEAVLTEVKMEMQSLEDSAAFKTYPDVKDNCRIRQGKEYQMCPYRNGCLEFNNHGR